MKRNVLRGVLAASVALGLIGVGTAANAVPDPASAVLAPSSGPRAGGTDVTVDAPPGVTFTQVSAGANHTVALAAGGTALTWGNNYHGQLGNGSTAQRLVPVPVKMPAGVTLTQVSAGSGHTLALASDGSVYSWGGNFAGQLGNGKNDGSSLPVQVQRPAKMPAGVTLTQVSAGSSHSVALASDGSVYAWGSNILGALGDGTYVERNVPVRSAVPGPETVTQVSAGSYHTVALNAQGVAFAWGVNFNGQLGIGGNSNSNSNSFVPLQVKMPDTVTFTQVSAGSAHSVALDEDGVAYVWGENAAGELENGTGADSFVPVPVRMPPGVAFSQVSAGTSGSVARTADSAAYAWGKNDFGQLGSGTIGNSSVPLRVTGGVPFSQVSAGYWYSVVLDDEGTVSGWGYNGYGMLGDGTTTNKAIPTPVSRGVTLTGVSFGGISGTGLVDAGDGTWTVTTPPHAAGPVDVVVSWSLNGVAQPDITHAGAFTSLVPDVAPTVTDPVDQAVTAGDPATFAVDATGTPAPVVTWEVSADDGASWNAVVAADGAVSADGTTLTVVATEALQGTQYRAIATNSVGAAATLTVVPVRAGTDDRGGSGGVPGRGLARTGGQAEAPIAAAALVLLAGAGLLFASRRRRA